MRAIPLLALLALTGLGVRAQDPWKNIYTEKAWTERDQWQRADAIMAKLNLQAGDKVADVGCHEGYMTMKLTHAVGDQGRVYAVDVQQSKLDKLNALLKDNGITNVTTVRGDYDNPHLPANSLDGALIIDTYHEMDRHDEMLGHIKAALKAGGRLVICEPIAASRRGTSREGQARRHEIGMGYVLADLQKAGFKVIFRQDPYVEREKIKGDKMWLIVAVK